MKHKLAGFGAARDFRAAQAQQKVAGRNSLVMGHDGFGLNEGSFGGVGAASHG